MVFRSAVSAVVFLLFAAFVVHGPFGAARLESELAGRTREDLAAVNLDWAHADADGQAIMLSGEAPDEAAREKAFETALTVIGPGGAAFGAVTKVDAQDVTVSPPRPVTIPISDYRFEAELKNGALTLSGFAPSEAGRAALADAVGGSAFVADNTKIAALEDEASWVAASAVGLRALSMLEQGTLRQQGAVFRISGSAKDPSAADAAAGLFAGSHGAYSFERDITFSKPAAPPAAPAPTVADPAVCQAALNSVLNGRRLTFHRNSVSLSNADRALLDDLAAATGNCPPASIVIEGHTDSVGRASTNLALSRRRAEAVKAHLDVAGDADLFSIKAYGETRPIASNRTRQGQQRNRRIDFIVAAADAESD